MSCGLGARVVLHDLWSRVWFRVWFGVNVVSTIKNVLLGVKKSERRKDFTYMTVETFQFIFVPGTTGYYRVTSTGIHLYHIHTTNSYYHRNTRYLGHW